MKFIKKFNESNSIKYIANDIKEIFLDISENYRTFFEWESDGLDQHEIEIIIHTDEFISKEDYDYQNYLGGFFYIHKEIDYDYLYKTYDIENMINFYQQIIKIYDDINVSLNRLKQQYPNSYYQIMQKNTNKSIIKVKIYIEKNETK